ncbi:MAG: 16S rRNA (guanine(527)-N(7))-methyltransferase RsmG [Thermoanaerobaculia bacterium]
MSVRLKPIPRSAFRAALATATGETVSPGLAASLHTHYEALRLWAGRTALVGVGEAERVLERHYAESLIARQLVAPARNIVDLGSGAGFPGWVLAAAHPECRFWLVEARQRKAAFLRSAAARAGLSCRIVNARVSRRQPLDQLLDSEGRPSGAIDLVTLRAVRWTEDICQGLGLVEGARVLRWEGAQAIEPVPGASPGRTVSLPHSNGRIQEWLMAGSPGG